MHWTVRRGRGRAVGGVEATSISQRVGPLTSAQVAQGENVTPASETSLSKAVGGKCRVFRQGGTSHHASTPPLPYAGPTDTVNFPDPSTTAFIDPDEHKVTYKNLHAHHPTLMTLRVAIVIGQLEKTITGFGK